jgi:hypothetical protein
MNIEEIKSKVNQYIYIIREREFIRTNEAIYKLGKTKRTPNERCGGYPKHSDVILFIKVSDCDDLETLLIREFKLKFKHLPDYGNEYFEGDCDDMSYFIIKFIKMEKITGMYQPPIEEEKTVSDDINNQIVLTIEITVNDEINSLNTPIHIAPSEIIITDKLGNDTFKIFREPGNEYINITELRRLYSKKNLGSHKQYKKSSDICGKELFKLDLKKSTCVHESVLESVLRFYDLDEQTVIDVFVDSKYREIKQYSCEDFNVLIHLETKYINASRISKIYSKKGGINDWVRLPSSKYLMEYYCKKYGKKKCIYKGIGYDLNDVWIPVDLLYPLMGWCSPNYIISSLDMIKQL